MAGTAKCAGLVVVAVLVVGLTGASCLGAAFLGANKTTFRLTGRRLAIWQDIVRHVGDEYNDAHVRDHGSRKNHGYWTIRAFQAANPAVCNTFTAPAKRVS